MSDTLKESLATDQSVHPIAPIPYGRQWIEEDDIQAVVEVLRSDWLTQGPKVKEFEEHFAEYVGARYAVAVCNGTAALHCAYLAAGIGPGDEVITSPITFAATANAAFYCGAKPAFVDIDPHTYNLDPGKLEKYLESNPAGKPKAIVPVHLAGLPCEMEKIHKIAKKYHLLVIEDACHALGAQYRHTPEHTDRQDTRRAPESMKTFSSPHSDLHPQGGKGLASCDSQRRLVASPLRGEDQGGGEIMFHPHSKGTEDLADDWTKVGSCRHSDMSVFSFHPVKHITCAEGGMITTNSKEWYDRLLVYRNHGIIRDEQKALLSGLDSRFYYEMRVLGYNFRMNDMQAALGLSQLKKNDDWLERRWSIADQYLRSFADMENVMLPHRNGCAKSAYHLFVLQVKPRESWLAELMAQGIMCQIHYIPVPIHPFYAQNGYTMAQLPEAGSYYGKCLSLPIFPKMTNAQVNRVIEAVKRIGKG